MLSFAEKKTICSKKAAKKNEYTRKEVECLPNRATDNR